MLGMEAGQSAFGDVYVWFKKVLLWPVENVMTESELVDAGANCFDNVSVSPFPKSLKI